jgi:hypothetical protein
MTASPPVAPDRNSAAGPENPIRAELPNRSRTMHLLYEDLARAQIADRLDEAARLRRINRIQAARRLARRAERASLRARRALALASLP